jgi:hypothetical protein
MICKNCGDELTPHYWGLYKYCDGCRERRAQAKLVARARARLERGMVDGIDLAAKILSLPVAAVAELEDRNVLHRHKTLGGTPVYALSDLEQLNAAGYGGNERDRRPGATLDKQCPTCTGHFVGPKNTIYCGEWCKTKAHNDKYYAENRDRLIENQIARRKKKQSGE